jgi:hypothetical protein
MLEARSVFHSDFSGVNIFSECFDAPDRVFDFRPDFRRRRQRRIPQPIMTNHAVLCGIGDSSRLQFSHRVKRMLDLRLHFLEQIVRKFHPADVQRETELTMFQEVSLRSLP